MGFANKNNKFGHIKKMNGFRSKFESNVSKNSHEGTEYETQKLSYTVHHTYTPDFVIKSKSKGNNIYIETKGYFSSSDRKKMLAVKDCNPELDIRIVLQKDNKISKKSKTTYSVWCQKNGFKWAIGKIPDDWYK